MTAGIRPCGIALAESAGELARLWRTTRAQARPGVWPGLLDGLVDDLFTQLGEGLAEGRDPALVWPGLTGIVRLDPREPERSRGELDAEWELVESVLEAACDALGSGDEVSEWLRRALVIARAGTRALDRGGGPPGVAVIWSLSGPHAPTRVRGAGPP